MRSLSVFYRCSCVELRGFDGRSKAKSSIVLLTAAVTWSYRVQHTHTQSNRKKNYAESNILQLSHTTAQHIHTQPSRKTRTVQPGTYHTPADHHLELLAVGNKAEGSPKEHERSGELKQINRATGQSVCVGRRLQEMI